MRCGDPPSSSSPPSLSASHHPPLPFLCSPVVFLLSLSHCPCCAFRRLRSWLTAADIGRPMVPCAYLVLPLHYTCFDVKLSASSSLLCPPSPLAPPRPARFITSVFYPDLLIPPLPPTCYPIPHSSPRHLRHLSPFARAGIPVYNAANIFPRSRSLRHPTSISLPPYPLTSIPTFRPSDLCYDLSYPHTRTSSVMYLLLTLLLIIALTTLL